MQLSQQVLSRESMCEGFTARDDLCPTELPPDELTMTICFDQNGSTVVPVSEANKVFTKRHPCLQEPPAREAVMLLTQVPKPADEVLPDTAQRAEVCN